MSPDIGRDPVLLSFADINERQIMKQTIGIILIVLGVLALAYQGITYTKREKVLDIGPIEATTEKNETIPLPPVLGVCSLIGGVLLLVSSRRTAH
jgi:hypothetical protein